MFNVCSVHTYRCISIRSMHTHTQRIRTNGDRKIKSVTKKRWCIFICLLLWLWFFFVCLCHFVYVVVVVIGIQQKPFLWIWNSFGIHSTTDAVHFFLERNHMTIANGNSNWIWECSQKFVNHYMGTLIKKLQINKKKKKTIGDWWHCCFSPTLMNNNKINNFVHDTHYAHEHGHLAWVPVKWTLCMALILDKSNSMKWFLFR